ncbi:MAG: hypothetical protein ACP5G1_03045 [Nanopusillaceae archaeon]
MDIVNDAIKHDEKLNIEEIKSINNIRKTLEDIRRLLTEYETVLDELEEFNQKELSNPMLKEEEFKIFIKLLDIEQKIQLKLTELNKKTLEYKYLLDLEVY